MALVAAISVPDYSNLKSTKYKYGNGTTRTIINYTAVTTIKQLAHAYHPSQCHLSPQPCLEDHPAETEDQSVWTVREGGGGGGGERREQQEIHLYE